MVGFLDTHTIPTNDPNFFSETPEFAEISAVPSNLPRAAPILADLSPSVIPYISPLSSNPIAPPVSDTPSVSDSTSNYYSDAVPPSLPVTTSLPVSQSTQLDISSSSNDLNINIETQQVPHVPPSSIVPLYQYKKTHVAQYDVSSSICGR